MARALGMSYVVVPDLGRRPTMSRGRDDRAPSH